MTLKLTDMIVNKYTKDNTRCPDMCVLDGMQTLHCGRMAE